MLQRLPLCVLLSFTLSLLFVHYTHWSFCDFHDFVSTAVFFILLPLQVLCACGVEECESWPVVDLFCLLMAVSLSQI